MSDRWSDTWTVICLFFAGNAYAKALADKVYDLYVWEGPSWIHMLVAVVLLITGTFRLREGRKEGLRT